MSLDYNKKNIVLAKNLRKNATPQEQRLWYGFLSKYEIRFQRQKAIDYFIADFYCHKAKLIIELDGSQHRTAIGKEKDEFRTSILEGYLPAILKLLRLAKKPRVMDLGLVAVRPEYQNSGVNAVLVDGIVNMLSSGMVEKCETNLNLETNAPVIAQWKYMKARQHKRRRAFIKKI